MADQETRNHLSTGAPPVSHRIERTLRQSGGIVGLLIRVLVGTGYWLQLVYYTLIDHRGKIHEDYAKSHSTGGAQHVNTASMNHRENLHRNMWVAAWVTGVWLVIWLVTYVGFRFTAWFWPVVTIAAQVVIGTIRGAKAYDDDIVIESYEPPTQTVAGINTGQIIQGLRDAIGSIDTLFRNEERRQERAAAKALKGGSRRDVLPRPIFGDFDLRQDERGIVETFIQLPGKATVGDLKKPEAVDRLAKHVGKPASCISFYAYDNVPDRLALRILPEPLELMKLPAWPHLDGEPTDVFEGFVVGFDDELQPVYARFAESSTGYAGQTNTGKSNAMMIESLGWILDPITQTAAFNFSGNKQLAFLEPYCRVYTQGQTNENVKVFHDFLVYLLDVELRKRTDALNAIPDEIVPEGKYNRAAAELDPTLAPLRWYVDEIQVAFGDAIYGEACREMVTTIVKELRKYGITSTAATQEWRDASIPRAYISQLQNITCLRLADPTDVYLVMAKQKHDPLSVDPSLFPEDDSSQGLAALKGNYFSNNKKVAKRMKYPYITIPQAKQVVAGLRKNVTPIMLPGSGSASTPRNPPRQRTIVEDLLSVWLFDEYSNPEPSLPIAFLAGRLCDEGHEVYANYRTADDLHRKTLTGGLTKAIHDLGIETHRGSRWVSTEPIKAGSPKDGIYKGRRVNFADLNQPTTQRETAT